MTMKGEIPLEREPETRAHGSSRSELTFDREQNKEMVSIKTNLTKSFKLFRRNFQNQRKAGSSPFYFFHDDVGQFSFVVCFPPPVRHPPSIWHFIN